MSNKFETTFARELSGLYSKYQLLSSIQLMRQQNLELYPNDGSVEELKRQQVILEHVEYAIRCFPEEKGN